MGWLLVTGGAGYVGSHCVRELLDRGERVVVLDNLSEGHREAVSGAELVVADLAGPETPAKLDQIFGDRRFELVLHFAGRAYVGESARAPEKYYRNNLSAGVELLAAMARHRVPAIVFSSSCAIYGQPETLPIAEDHPERPLNAYGRTKVAFENALRDFETAYGIRYINLRYFNAAGAHPEGDLGEVHRPETHLIPLALEVAMGEKPTLPVYGVDYPTRDATCIRDFIHVSDLASAHQKAVEALRSGAPSTSYNLGLGRGYSVLEVVETVRRVSGKAIPTQPAPRRPGDPAELVAAGGKIARELGWKPAFTSLEAMVETAWRFKQRHPAGYGRV